MKTIEVNWDKIRQARKLLWYTWAEFSDKAKLSKDHLYRIEWEKEKTTEETLKKIISILNKPILKTVIDTARIKKSMITKLKEDYTYNYFLKK